METNDISCIIGIDAGANGGIAVFVPGRNVRVIKMPRESTDLRDLLQYYADNYKTIVFLEKLSVRPDDVIMQGNKAAMGKIYRIQKMMANFEQLKALIEVVGIPYVQVHPLSWQAKLKLRVAGIKEEKHARKRRYQEYVQGLYPLVKVTLWNADALLIMHFGRWALENEPKWIKANLPAREYDKLF